MKNTSKKNNNQNGETFQKKRLSAKTDGQQRLLDAFDDNKVIFGLGPSGTGKTHLAIGYAAKAITRPELCLDKIVLSRPVVSADGEDIGALPGDIEEKIHPYLLPLYDELKYFVSYSDIREMKNSGVLEIAPVAYMRGRTFKNAVVILDEAQNCTFKQLKMILTRLGENSKIIITGDINQTDLSYNHSGLAECARRLRNKDLIDIVELTKMDIVRDPLVAEILEALEDERFNARN